jgi:histone H3/H4
MKIEDATTSIVSEIWQKIGPDVRKSNFLEEGAQELASVIHSRFDESVVIARVFFTVPFDSLPPANKVFVRKLAEGAGAGAQIKGTTPVLTLVGTHGVEEDWKDRRKSRGHAGIPLISSAFVGAIPMISRLLKELGVPMDWVDSHDSEIIKKAVRGTVGVFFVDDAAEAVDHEGRKIIAAQDFVRKYGVKSVFGIGEAYDNGQMLVMVVFCRDAFSRDVAERFVTLAGAFKTDTSSLVEQGKIFS